MSVFTRVGPAPKHGSLQGRAHETRAGIARA
jgi:hypothetical protein